MLNLIPWKKRGNSIRVRHSEPTRPENEGDMIVRLRDDLDSLMRRFFEDRWLSDRFFGNVPSLWGDLQWDRLWDSGLEDKENEYVFRAEMPGFEPEDFDVKVSGNVVTVRAEHKDEKQEGNGGSAYRYGSYCRTFTIPQGVDEEKIDARYHSGVLELHLPKTGEARGKRIEVRNA